jgi:virulence factor
MIHAATAVHGKLAELCLRAGIPTFVDKPHQVGSPAAHRPR